MHARQQARRQCCAGMHVHYTKRHAPPDTRSAIASAVHGMLGTTAGHPTSPASSGLIGAQMLKSPLSAVCESASSAALVDAPSHVSAPVVTGDKDQHIERPRQRKTVWTALTSGCSSKRSSKRQSRPAAAKGLRGSTNATMAAKGGVLTGVSAARRREALLWQQGRDATQVRCSLLVESWRACITCSVQVGHPWTCLSERVTLRKGTTLQSSHASLQMLAVHAHA